MSSVTVAVSSITDIPAAIRNFASSLGWNTASLGGDAYSITHPTYTSAKSFRVEPDITGSGASLRHRLKLSLPGVTSDVSLTESPKLNPTQVANSSSVVLMQPTQLYLFGEIDSSSTDSAGDSFIAGVIEYGFNLYRHFFLGYLSKSSSYVGGEVVTGSRCWTTPVTTSNATSIHYREPEEVSYPFGGLNTLSTGTAWQNLSGGAFIEHANNPVSWRRFFYPASRSTSDFDANFADHGDNMVLGGYGDSINSGSMCAGKSPFAAAQILSPITIYLGQILAGQQFFRAVGSVPGVRLIAMDELEPGAIVTIGSSQWRVFPVFSKRTSTTMTRVSVGAAWPANTGYPPNNTSYMVGMAYRVSP